jgi:hypothetical protein
MGRPGVRPALSAMGATVRASSSSTHARVGDEPDEGDSSGRSRAPWALILAGLIVSASAGVAAAQSVPVPPPTSEVSDTIDDVDGVKDDVVDQTKAVTNKVKRKATRAVSRSERVARETVVEIQDAVSGNKRPAETRVATRTKAADKKPGDKRDHRDATAQEGDSRGDENEDGDINTLVDAGNEIEGTRVESARAAPDPTRRQETLPLTGLDPRALSLTGLSLISAGLLLVVRGRPHPVARP